MKKKYVDLQVKWIVSLTIAISMVVLFILSCQKTDIKLLEPDFTLYDSNNSKQGNRILFSPEASSREFDIQSDGHWDLVNDSDWINVSKNQGDKNDKIVISVSENTYLKREGVLKFITDTIRIDTFHIYQDGRGLTLEVNPDQLKEISPMSEEYTFFVETNENEWDYNLDNQNWISEIDRTNNTITFLVEDNFNENLRETFMDFELVHFPDFNQKVIISQLGQKLPIPDLFNVVFEEVGSDIIAQDISPLELEISYEKVDHPVTMNFNERLNVNVAHFDPPLPGSWLGYRGAYYRIEFIKNEFFEEKLSDGFSMECLVKFDHNFDENPEGYAVGIMSMLGAGGAGINLAKDVNNITYEIFLPKSVKVHSSIIPNNNIWYHIIGVWDKENEKVSLYVNGEHQESVVAPDSEYVGPDVDRQFLGIGANPKFGNTIGDAFQGSFAVGRIYNEALSSGEITVLWNMVKKINE